MRPVHFDCTTRCQHPGLYLLEGCTLLPEGEGLCTFQGVYLLGCTWHNPPHTLPRDQGSCIIPPSPKRPGTRHIHPKKDLEPGIPTNPPPEGTWNQAYPSSEGNWDQAYPPLPCGQNDRHL